MPKSSEIYHIYIDTSSRFAIPLVTMADYFAKKAETRLMMPSIRNICRTDLVPAPCKPKTETQN